MKQTVIGLTGGTGCGKTTALCALEALGVSVIDCDALYHHLLETDSSLLCAISDAFPGVVENGVLCRKRLGAQVFSDSAALAQLNTIVWPYICRAVAAEIASRSPRPCAIDAIGLLESGLGALCTVTVAITAPEQTRIARLMAREGISEEYAHLRIQAQKTNDVFAAACGLTIENTDACAADFQSRCRTIFQTILKEDNNQ